MVTEALVSLVVVLLVALGVCAIELWSLPRRRRRCLVNLHDEDGTTIEGVLWARRGVWLVIKDARLIRPTGEVVPADGEVLIDRARISFLQVL